METKELYEDFNSKLSDIVKEHGPDVAATCCFGGIKVMFNAGYPKSAILGFISSLMDVLEDSDDDPEENASVH